MKIEPVFRAKAVHQRLLGLLKDCDTFSWASAWVTKTDLFEAAISARQKMKHFVIGTHRYITDPDCLDACLDISAAHVIAPEGPMFHPKVYAFKLEGKVVVYVGSSNLTNGGLSNNVECGVFLSAEPSHPQLEQFFDFIDAQWAGSDGLDEDFIVSYRANKLRVKDAQDALEQFIRIKKPRRSIKSANDVNPQAMGWGDFVRLVRNDEAHGANARLKVLSSARRIFASGRPFAEFAEIERKSLAGLLKPSIREEVNWGYFGQMSAFGQYSPILQNHVKIISKALGHIPLVGPVKRENFDAYLDVFTSIPGASMNWIGMGTRLVTMKRPDQFVCIDSANREGLCAYFGAAPTTTNLGNYWDRIIAQIMLTPWWNADIPGGPLEQEIWHGRAAMLDAIYYDPTR